jgi:4-hydroxy-tetrahydrodipicolinate reductase
MLRILVCGAAGRMGGRLVALAGEDESLTVTAAVERPEHPSIGRDAGVVAGVAEVGAPIGSDLAVACEAADVAIAFVNDPAVSAAQAAACAQSGTPLVVGTTGMTDEHDAAFVRDAAGIPVVRASNFSVGMTVLLGLVEQASSVLGESYDCEIVEAHHTAKKDAPSGTAINLGEAAANGRGWSLSDVAVHGRSGFIGERPGEQIGIHAIRAGDIVGRHTVLFGGTGETIEMTHQVQSRDTFAMGALRAAKWVVDQPPGIYDMRDVLGLR